MPRHVFAPIKVWRARDQHTGIGKSRGVPYTYRHVPSRLEPPPKAEVYRIETFIPFAAPTPVHNNVHYVPGDQLDDFFFDWGQHAETVIDIRPLTTADALAELHAFRQTAEAETKPAH
jgi:hypothetical protein